MKKRKHPTFYSVVSIVAFLWFGALLIAFRKYLFAGTSFTGVTETIIFLSIFLCYSFSMAALSLLRKLRHSNFLLWQNLILTCITFFSIVGVYFHDMYNNYTYLKEQEENWTPEKEYYFPDTYLCIEEKENIECVILIPIGQTHDYRIWLDSALIVCPYNISYQIQHFYGEFFPNNSIDKYSDFSIQVVFKTGGSQYFGFIHSDTVHKKVEIRYTKNGFEMKALNQKCQN